MLNYILSFFGILKLFLASFLFIFLVFRIYRKNPPRGTIFICIFFSLFFFIQYCEEVTKAFSASPNLHTFDAVVEDIRWPVDIVLIENKGEKYCRVTVTPGNPFASFMIFTSFRSGLPEYMFNMQGLLVDSTSDFQDDSRYQSQWGNAIKMKRIKQKDFLAETRGYGTNIEASPTNGHSSQ